MGIVDALRKGKGIHLEHLNYHCLYLVILVNQELLADAEVFEDVMQSIISVNGLSCDFANGRNS